MVLSRVSFILDDEKWKASLNRIHARLEAIYKQRERKKNEAIKCIENIINA
ncbi:MAG: hypothetical protein WAM14_01475 [Candidatus Nitrosopolaris sp.]